MVLRRFVECDSEDKINVDELKAMLITTAGEEEEYYGGHCANATWLRDLTKR